MDDQRLFAHFPEDIQIKLRSEMQIQTFAAGESIFHQCESASAIFGIDTLKKISVPLFHDLAGLVIFLGPFLTKKAPKGFWWVGIGGVLIGLGGIALAFISMGAQLLFFSPSFVMLILTPLLFLMTLAFTFGFVKDILG